MEVTIKNKHGQVIKKIKYNPVPIGLGIASGTIYGAAIRRCVINCCRGSKVGALAGTVLGCILGSVVGVTVHDFVDYRFYEDDDDIYEGGDDDDRILD